MVCRTLTLFAVLSVLFGCGYRDLSKNDVKEIDTSNENVLVVASDLDRSSKTRPHASILKDQVAVSKAALALTEEQKRELSVSATVDKERLAENPAAEAARSQEDKEKRLKGIEEDHASSGFWGWIKGGGLMAAVLMALGVADRLGLPGAGIARGVVRMIAPRMLKEGEEKASEYEHRMEVASEAVISSDIGRWGLQELDKLLPEGTRQEVAPIISKLTKGHTDTVEGLFRYLAKGTAVDRGTHGEVDTLLTQLRDLLPTEGGVPSALGRLMNRET